jgi:hypothetical protein
VSIETYLIWRTTGVEVDEVRYRMTLKPAIRQRKQNESHEDYLAGSARSTRPARPLPARGDRPPHPRRLPAARAGAVGVGRADPPCPPHGVWPRNTAACHDHGGCRFLALCAREPGAEHQFVERESDPRRPHDVLLPDKPQTRKTLGITPMNARVFLAGTPKVGKTTLPRRGRRSRR